MNRFCVGVLDVVLFPFTLIASLVMLAVRRIGVERLSVCKAALRSVGVFPIRRHYYEPLIDTEPLRAGLAMPRDLPGIDLNVSKQLGLLSQFDFGAELRSLPLKSDGSRGFYHHNPRFGPGDAELLYCMIRRFSPRRLIEIGSGFSTLVAREALGRNGKEVPACSYEHVCIEPYEEPWLEQCGATVRRERVETVDKSIFLELVEDDILFIDSSHMIRPGGCAL